MFARAPSSLLGRALVAVAVLIVVVVACTLATAPHPNVVSTPTPSPSSSPTASPSPTPTPTARPTPTLKPAALLSRRVTILILGSDSNPDRLARGMGKLTDSIIVLSVNAKHTQVSMISFPRDIVDIPLGDGTIWPQKINAISYYRGEAAMKRAIAITIGKPIDYYVEVNMVDFGAMVNAIGGIDVTVPTSIYDASIGLSVAAGRRHMDGNMALRYARSRHTTSDWDRAARQQLILAAIVRKMVQPSTKINFLEMIGSLRSLQTDMPLGGFSTFFEIARRSARARVVGGVLTPPGFATFAGIEAGTGRGYIEEPDIRAIRAYASSLFRD